MHPIWQHNVVEQSHDPLLFCVLTFALVNSHTTTIISSSVEMERRLVPLVVLTIFLLTETTTGSEQHLTQKRQSIRAQGCIAAGYTHCCAFGSCRVELPDGGQCHCDHYCVDNSYYSYSNYLHHNCCSDNPCEGNLGTKSLIALIKGLQSSWKLVFVSILA